MNPTTIIPALFFLILLTDLGGDFYDIKWVMIFLLSAGGFAWAQVGKKLGWIPAATLIYLLSSAALTWLFRDNRYVTINPYDQTAIRYFAADSAAKLLALLVPIFIARESLGESKFRFYGQIGVLMFFFLAVIFTLGEWIIWGCAGDNRCGGVLRNPSMNSCFLIVCLPIVMDMVYGNWRKIAYAAIALACVLIQKSSAALGLFAVGAATWGLWHLLENRERYATFWHVAARAALGFFLGGGALAIGYASYGAMMFFADSGRFGMWKFAMEMWAGRTWNVIFGTGFGTFGVFSPWLQKYKGLNADFNWWFMHNDWLQILFETGVIGLLLCLATWAATFWGLSKKRMIGEMVSVNMLWFYMALNFPTHLAVTCVFTAWIAVLGLRKSELTLSGE